MTYEIIYQIYGGEYDLLTCKEFEGKDSDFWDECGEGWQSLADEVNLQKLRLACERRGISLDGTVTPYNSGSGFPNFRYRV